MEKLIDKGADGPGRSKAATDPVREPVSMPADADALACGAEDLWGAIGKFSRWLEKEGYASYDPYDVWGTRYGRWSRRLYYRKHPLGLFLTAPIILLEILLPQWRALCVRKDRYPTADAQLALAFLNLHETERLRGGSAGNGSSAWLGKARALAADLLKSSIPGYSGHCWGYPFDWENVNGLMPKGTPHITATPYCYEVFARLGDWTGEDHYLEVARSAAVFIYKDLNDTPTGEDSAASSYTPHDYGKVVNAVAYRAYILFDAAERFGSDAYRERAWKNLRFILQSQREDGSWLYAIDNPREAFIDHFHTCFVLKNLFKLNRILNSPEVRKAIRIGYDYYRTHLYDAEGNPKLYAVAPRTEIVRLEMYNVAEAITLGALLRDEIPAAFSTACRLARQLIEEHQLPAGYFVTRTYRGGFRHKVPFLRWPQSQLFYGLTNLLLAMVKGRAGAQP